MHTLDELREHVTRGARFHVVRLYVKEALEISRELARFLPRPRDELPQPFPASRLTAPARRKAATLSATSTPGRALRSLAQVSSSG